MKAPRTRLARLVADQTLDKGVSGRFAREVAAYLLSEGRVDELDSLLRDVQEDWAEAGHVEVTARSAHPLTAAVKDDIRREVKKVYPAAKRIVINEVTDPAVVGGVRLNMPSRQLDLSIRAKLNLFKQAVTAGKD
ncbi:MAG TPA: F0F1 ATP synthase subunit delta [Candidatus Saccharimonadales bacterium]|jgi:F0F1-type ATP synthase delta subunit|nr:F0F1 ATP synthase subunit delta [Candidatus Saccharimonadales bacterium]